MGMQQALMGGSYVDPIALQGRNLVDGVGSPTDAYTGFRLTSTGLQQEVIGLGAYTTIGTWLVNSANAALYEVRVTVNSGTLSGGSDPTGSWLGLGTTRTWFLTRSAVGSDLCDTTVEIRQASTGLVLATAPVTYEVEVF